MDEIVGRCLCGAVEYSAAEPGVFVTCYCRDCRYASGGAPANVLLVQQAGFKLRQGAANLQEYKSTADSGHGVTREFCGNCGTPMFERLEILEPQAMLIRVGTVDAQQDLKPEVTVWTKSIPAWEKLQDTTVHFEANPDDEEMARRLAGKS